MVLATPFYALFFALLWLPPVAGESVANALYFFLMLEAFHLFSTLSGGPFESLLPEIAVTSRDRVSVVTWQVFFGTLGAALALVGSGIVRDLFGFQAMAAMAAVIALVSRYVALAGAWRHVRLDVEPARINPLAAMRSTFTNDQFLYFLPTFVLFNMAISLMTAALPFWAGAVLLGGLPADIAKVETGHQATLLFLGLELNVAEGTIVALMTAAAIVVVLLTLPLAYRLAMRRGKAWVYSTAMLLGAFYLPWIAFMGFVPGVDKLAQALLFVAAMGVPMAAVFTFPNAITADIIDYDELRTGHAARGHLLRHPGHAGEDGLGPLPADPGPPPGAGEHRRRPAGHPAGGPGGRLLGPGGLPGLPRLPPARHRARRYRESAVGPNGPRP